MPLYSLDGMAPSLPERDRYWIAPDAQVIGNVVLGDEASVWFGAVLRGDNEAIKVGARSNIQDGCLLHADAGYPLEIGADCSIGHHAVLHSCTVGDNSLIGMGAILLNGAHVGRNCLVGAHALLTEGKSFPDNSLIVGSSRAGHPHDRCGDGGKNLRERGPLCAQLAPLRARTGAYRRNPIDQSLMFSSKRSASIMRSKATAKPPSKWRTTLPVV